ncbi:DNA replication factor C complex subunit Rfc1 [Diatrype stigma]|uniref:Aspartate aminotransferase n=1 Tax=Diatrype stigma TaxID=117547 RepID=A0AAN9UEZ1_9PEZI
MGSTNYPSSIFDSVEFSPYDDAFKVLAAFASDPHPDKVSLGAGVYRDDNAQPWTLSSVKKAIPLLPDNHDYLPFGGFPPYLEVSRELLFGDLIRELGDRLCTIQTVSGTGACHVGAVFLVNTIKPRTAWISDPSWVNHSVIWECAGPTVHRKFYPYYDSGSRSLDFSGMIGKLENEAEKGDVVILQACAHNPTGLDPSKSQWSQIADVCEAKGLLDNYDSQGFASGDPDEDAWAVRHFASRSSLEIGFAQSFSKNFGLYGERVGAFHLLTRNSSLKPAIQSQLVRIMRSEVSSSPSFGCRIVATVLSDDRLREQWQGDLKTMSARIRSMREALYAELQRLGTPGDWGHIVSQVSELTILQT